MIDGVDPPALEVRKADCRMEIRRRLAELDAGDRAERSRRLVGHLVESDPWRRARHIAIFLPIAREPDVRSAIEKARSAGKTVLLPRSVVDPPGVELVPLRGADLDALPKDPLGVPAPPGPAIRSDRGDVALDLVVVPGVAFDGTGGRLGRGGGYYDRLLERLRRGATPPVVGTCFACQCVAEVPRAPHDEPVSFVCTEDGLAGPFRRGTDSSES